MATGNSGTITGNYMPDTGLRPNFYWEVRNPNPDTGKATVYYKLYMSGNTTDYRIYGTANHGFNYLKVNGSTVFQITSEGNASYNDPIPAYSNESRHRNEPYYCQSYWDWTGWTKFWGKVEGTFQLSYDDDGNASFSVDGAFQSYWQSGTDKRVYIRDTITVNKMDRHSKIYVKRNNAWDNGGIIWYKENGTWKKKKCFYKENGTWKKK